MIPQKNMPKVQIVEEMVPISVFICGATTNKRFMATPIAGAKVSTQ